MIKDSVFGIFDMIVGRSESVAAGTLYSSTLTSTFVFQYQRYVKHPLRTLGHFMTFGLRLHPDEKRPDYYAAECIVKIIVFLKQVPDTQKVKIDPVRGTLVRKGVPSITNPFDESALELALELKEMTGGTVTALTMGIPDSREILYDALALGADEAVLITGSEFAGSDTLATAYALSTAVQSRGPFDLYLFGKQATDGDTAQVGPEVAAHLDIPVVTFVHTVSRLAGGIIVVERMIENGTQTVEVDLPAALTVVKAQKRLRMPCLTGIIGSFGKPLNRIGAVETGVDTSKCGLTGSPTRVKKIFSPKHQSKVRFIEGGSEEMARGFVEMLKREGVFGG